MVSTRRVRWLAPLALLVAALGLTGAWVGGLVGGPRVVAQGRALSGSLDPGARHTEDGASTLVTGAEASSQDPTRTTVDVGPSAEEVAAAEAAETAPVDEDPPQVIGRVVDPEGDPVAGATVIGATGWVQALPLELEGLGEADSWMQRARATTDPDGRFALEEGLMLGGELVVRVAAPGFAPLRLDRPPGALRTSGKLPLDYGELRLRDGCVARGRVVDRRGAAVPGAAVSLAVILGEQSFGVDYPSRGVPMAVTADDGTFTVDRLEPGPFTLLVDGGAQLVGRVTGVATKRPLDSLVVVLEAGSPIAGRVTGLEVRELAPRVAPIEASAPVGDVAGDAPEVAALAALRVEARPGKPDNSQVDGLDRALGGARTAAVAADGTFELAGLVEGLPYTLIVSELGEKGRWRRAAEVEPTLGWPGTRGVELAWKPRRRATFRVVDEVTGAPLERFHVQWRQGEHNGDDGFQYLTEGPDQPVRSAYPGGVVTLEDLPPGKAELEVAVKITGTGIKPKTAEHLAVKADALTDLGEVRVASAPTVRVTVKVKETEAPVAGAKVYMAPQTYEWLDWFVQSGVEALGNTDVSYGVTGEDGVAVLASMPGKPVKASASSSRFVAPEPTEALLTAGGGDELVVLLTEGGTLVVRVRRPNGAAAEGVKVHCKKQELGSGRRGGARWLEQVTDAEGLARFERLPAGMHECAVSTEDQGQNQSGMRWRAAQIVVGQEATLVLDTPATGTLSGTVFEAGEPLARVSLQLQTPGQSNGYDEWGGWGGWDGGTGSRRSATTRGDGSYSLGPVAAGEWMLTVRHEARAMAMKIPVRIQEGANTLDVRLDIALLEGTLVDERGEPIQGVDVHVSAPNEDLQGGAQKIRMRESPTGELDMDWDWETLDRKPTNADGRFAFRGVATARPLRLNLSHNHIEALQLDLSEFADGELRDLGEVVARPAGVLRVRRNTPTRDRLKVQVVRLSEDPSAASTAEEVASTGSLRGNGGQASFGSLRPGRYRVELVDNAGNVTQRQEAEVRARESTPVTFE